MRVFTESVDVKATARSRVMKMQPEFRQGRLNMSLDIDMSGKPLNSYSESTPWTSSIHINDVSKRYDIEENEDLLLSTDHVTVP
jgi:hypothetical protein